MTLPADGERDRDAHPPAARAQRDRPRCTARTASQDESIVLTEALELSHLDYEEFLASYESMTLALASHLRELGSYREAR